MADPTRKTSEEKAPRLAKWAFAIAMGVFILLALFTGYAISSYLQATASVRAAAERHAALNDASAALKDVQRGARGYLITGDERFLAPCQKGREDASRSISAVRESLKDFPARRTQLELAGTLTDTLLTDMAREVEFFRQGAIDRAQGIVKTGEPNNAMERVDAIFHRLSEEEDALANSEALLAENNLYKALALLVAGGGLNFIVIITIFIAVQRQLRERIRLSSILARSEGRLQLIIRSIQEGLTLSDASGRFEIYNPRMHDMTGYSMEEANASGVLGDLLNVSAGHTTDSPAPFIFERNIQARGGPTRTLRGCSRTLEHAGSRMFLTTYQDVTEERKKEEALRIQKAYFEQLFDSMPEGIALIDHNLRIRNVNAAYETIFGYSRMDALGTDFTTLTVPKEMTEDAVLALQRVLDGEVVTFETQRRRKDGRMIDVSIIATPVNLGTGQRMVYGIYRDITKRKKAEVEREGLITELQRAIAEIKTLSGLLPICAWCKKVRDDQGYYHQIEEYIVRHSDATFTHGICPQCADKFTDDHDHAAHAETPQPPAGRNSVPRTLTLSRTPRKG